MQRDFNVESARAKLVLVSDCDGTISQVRGEHPANHNSNLINYLVSMKEAGHTVILVSTTGNNAGGSVQTALMACKKPPTALDIDGYTVMPKGDLDDYLDYMKITKVDYVFDDEKVAYLPASMIGEHINPELFTEPDVPVLSFLPAPRSPI